MQLLVQLLTLFTLLFQLKDELVDHEVLLFDFPKQQLLFTFPNAFHTPCPTYLNSKLQQQEYILITRTKTTSAMTSPICLKEYTCFQYEHMLKGQLHPVKQSPVLLKFKGNTPCMAQDLRYDIIDRLHPDGHEKAYICKWQNSSTKNTQLYFFDFKTKQPMRVTMSERPKFVTIVADHMFIVGGSELFILSIHNLQVVRTHALGMDTIHAVQPAFKQSDLSSRGVAVYSWNDRQGYTKRFFSHHESHEQKWWTNLTSALLLKKPPQQLVRSELKIIIPNVLGLLILSSMEEICLVNLATMQPVRQCFRKLSNWSFTKTSKAIIKYYVHHNSEQFDDSLLISLAEVGKDIIQVFVLHVNYLPEIAAKVRTLKQEGQSEEMGLPSMTNGEVVDWNGCLLQNFFTYSSDGGLIDYLLVEKGLIFFARGSSEIPSAGFINYYNPLNVNPILTLQHNICTSFVADIQVANQLAEARKRKDPGLYSRQNQLLNDCQEQLLNSILRPNRYSLPFLYANIGVNSVSQINGKTLDAYGLLATWYKAYRVKKVIKFDGDILVLRECSITSFLSIDPIQFACEFENGENLMKNKQGLSQILSIASFELSINDSNYSQNFPTFNHIPAQSVWRQLNEYLDVGFTYQKEGTFSLDEGPVTKELCQNYEKYLDIFGRKISTAYTEPIEDIFQSQQLALKSQILSKMLIQNRVKDLLLFYCKLLKFLFVKTRDHYINKFEHGSLSKKEKLIINYLSGVSKLINLPLHQICAHGADLVQIFVTQQINSLFSGIEKQRGSDSTLTAFVHVEKQSWKMITKLFEEVVVVTPTKKSPINGFIKLLINYIKEGFQYIQYILLEIFNPYTNLMLIEEAPSQLAAFGQRAIHSNQQAHYPFTSTLLSIYCCFPISQEVQQQLLTSCMLSTLLAQGNQKSINQLLSEVIGPKSIKDRMRAIYLQSKDPSKKQGSIKTSTGRSDRGYSKSQREREQDELDSSLGIVELAKALQPQALQTRLLALNEEELDSVFRGNVESLLGRGEIEELKYTNEQILLGWIFKYRTYVQKYRNIIDEITSVEKEILKEKHANENYKKIALTYANFCMTSLSNIKSYYSKLYVNLRAVLPREQKIKNHEEPHQEFGDSYHQENEWETIQKVCCRMIGYPSSHGLYLYQKTDKVCANQDYFTLVVPILKDEESLAESITSMDGIFFYYLLQISEQNQDFTVERKIELLKSIGKYRGRKQLCQFIMKNAVLCSNFEKLEDERLVRNIRNYFPYHEETGLAIGNLPSKMNLQGRRQNIRDGQFGEEYPVEVPPFRNCYLEAVGR